MTTPISADSPAVPMTGAQASLYQQLRGHLAALKLTAAAEHLPSVLAEAEAEQWSMTATLENLLAREVEATEARKLAGRLRFASLPTPASSPTSTSTPPPASTASSSTSSPPAATWSPRPTSC